MNITPTPEITELGNEEIYTFRDLHLPEELYELIINKFIGSLDMIQEYVLTNNTMEGNKKKFNSYIVRIRNFYKAVLWRRDNMYKAFLEIYKFCEDNNEIATEFARMVKESIEPVSNILKDVKEA